ncbi:hypothetical protein BJF79_04500 [Actinomadura sp. CNU-125]|nr:hypothetical protein BJF79_04500 [Actinomadura sp. CNU-125]
MTSACVPRPFRSTRIRSWMNAGPSTLTPTRTPCRRMSSTQRSLISVAFVWNPWLMSRPYRSAVSAATANAFS